MVINTPRINLGIKTEATGGLAEQNVLFIMPYTKAEYKKDVDINTLEDSHLKNMMLKFRELNKLTKLSYLSTTLPTPTNATATLTINSGLEVAKILKIYLVEEILDISIPKNSSIQQISDLISIELMKSQYVGSVDVSVDFATLTITLSNILMGALGNNIYFSTNDKTLITTTEFASGSLFTNYDLSLIGEDRYKNIIVSNVYNGLDVANRLKNSINNQYFLLDGIGAKAYKNQEEIDNDAIDNNEAFIQLHAKKSITHIDVLSVIFLALRSFRLTDGANLTDLIDQSAGVLNAVGGIGLSAIPYHNTNLTKYIKLADVYNMQETLDLESKRITLIDYDISGYLISINDVYTSYKVDSSGNNDEIFKYLNITDIALNSREYFYNAVRQRTKQSTMVRGISVANRGQFDKGDVKSILVECYQALTKLGIVQEETKFKESIFVEINNLLGEIQFQYELYPVIGVRSINGVVIVKL